MKVMAADREIGRSIYHLPFSCPVDADECQVERRTACTPHGNFNWGREQETGPYERLTLQYRLKSDTCFIPRQSRRWKVVRHWGYTSWRSGGLASVSLDDV